MTGVNGDLRETSDKIATAISLGLLRLIQENVTDEVDEVVAMRKVILLLLAATGGEGNEGVRQIQDWVMTEFTPIASHFEGHTQDWFDGHWVGRARDKASEHLTLVVPKDLVEKILSRKS